MKLEIDWEAVREMEKQRREQDQLEREQEAEELKYKLERIERLGEQALTNEC